MLLSAFIKNIARAARSNAPTTMTTSLAAAATSRSATFASSACAAARRGGANAAAASARGLVMPSAAAPMRSIKLLPPPSTSSSSRGFFAAAASASPPSSSSSSLVSVLDTEIKYEADHAPQGAPELPPGWALESGKGKGNGGGTGGGFEADGSARLSLRSTNPPPGEKITIELLVDEQDDDEESFPDEDDEEEGDAGNGGSSELGVGVVFTVTVEKDASPGSSLLFDCRSDGTYFQIMHVALEKKKKDEKKKIGGQEDDDDDDEFSGPHFDELDEALQAEFDAFLEERGVTASLGGALAALAEDKEAREYAAWLARVRDFVAAR